MKDRAFIVTECVTCGRRVEKKWKRAGAHSFCSGKCAMVYQRERDNVATWYLLQMLRQLWRWKPPKSRIRVEPYRDVKELRRVFKETRQWLEDVLPATKVS